MWQSISEALANGHDTPTVPAGLTVVGDVSQCADPVVSELALAAVSAAVGAVQSLVETHFRQRPAATIDRNLVDRWFKRSVLPQGWEFPPMWDALARDYPTRDGSIRLHTNAPHHRAAVLAALGADPTAEDVARRALLWTGEELETAVVAAGGCAAVSRPTQAWRAHPQGQAIAAEPVVAWTERPAQATPWRPSDPVRPLSGLRVLDLTRVLAGPCCTRFLACFGASVLRIDPEFWHEDGNAIEMTVGKACSTLDLKTEAGRQALLKLAGEAHILVTGYRADALERLHLDPASLRKANPDLVTVSLNAYGWTGPWRNRRGFDSLVQRSTGLAVPGPDGKMSELPFQVLDYATGYLAAASAIHALSRVASHGIVSSARLSLARQAQLLIDQPNITPRPSDDGQATLSTGAQSFEDTEWGPLYRLPQPFEIAGLAPGWRRPAHPLRTDPLEWPDFEQG